MELWHDFLTNDKRRMHKHTHYFPVYERHFSKFRGQSVTMLEIGVGHGGSLQMWKRYFGPFANIVGIDIRPVTAKVKESQISIRIGRQQDEKFLAELDEEFGPFDIILDDGSHIMKNIRASFEYLYPRMSKNGVYLVEDLSTAYWEKFGGGYRAKESFIEYAKNLIDELNAHAAKGQFEPTAFTRTTHSMCFYASMVCFERGLHFRRHGMKTGKKLDEIEPASEGGPSPSDSQEDQADG